MGYNFFLILAQNTKVLEFDFIKKRQLKIHNGHVIKVFMNLKKKSNFDSKFKGVSLRFYQKWQLMIKTERN
jgi:hypothetical protein